MTVARKENLDNLLAEMICKDNLPLTILRRERFRNFISAAMPEYKIPSYEKMRETLIPILYEKVTCAVKKQLESSKMCTIMMYLWSSNTMTGFIGVSCSSVTQNYIPFTCFLALK
jgi:hypothetical protein